jgi:hypothetical protein
MSGNNKNMSKIKCGMEKRGHFVTQEIFTRYMTSTNVQFQCTPGSLNEVLDFHTSDGINVFTLGSEELMKDEKFDGTEAMIFEFINAGTGRQGRIRLRNHYNGPDKRRARINEAEAIIKKLHYKGERYMTIKKFVTKLTGAY